MAGQRITKAKAAKFRKQQLEELEQWMRWKRDPAHAAHLKDIIKRIDALSASLYPGAGTLSVEIS